jgi:hypothetical protein
MAGKVTAVVSVLEIRAQAVLLEVIAPDPSRLGRIALLHEGDQPLAVADP